MRKLLLLLSILLAVSPLFNLANAQQPAADKPQQKPQTTQEPISPDSVVRISTRLVQIDAVVVDNDGRLVTNLKSG